MKKIGMMSAVLAGGAAFAADGIKMGGYWDTGWGLNYEGSSSYGFVGGEGALYFGKTMGNGEVMVDIPLAFSEYKAAEAATETSAAVAASPAGIKMPMAKSQAYVSWKYDSGLYWKMGLMDYALGYEAKDSPDRLFSKAAKSLMGSSQLGAVIGFNVSDSMGFGLLINQADFNTANKHDFGFIFNMGDDAFKFNAGFVYENSKTMLGDANVSMDMGAMGLAFDVQFKKEDGAKLDFGLLTQLDFEMNETMGLGFGGSFFRITEVNNIGVQVGPHFKMSKDFTVRTDFCLNKAGSADMTWGLHLNAVHKF